MSVFVSLIWKSVDESGSISIPSCCITILLLVFPGVKKIGLFFWINNVLFRHCQLAAIQAINWFCFQLWVGMILHPDQDRYPRVFVRPSLGMILSFLPASVVYLSEGVCLLTDSFDQFKVEDEVEIFCLPIKVCLTMNLQVSPICWVCSSQFVKFLRYQSCRFNQVAEWLTLVRTSLCSCFAH